MHYYGISSCTVCASESIQGLALYKGILSILKGKVTTVVDHYCLHYDLFAKVKCDLSDQNGRYVFRFGSSQTVYDQLFRNGHSSMTIFLGSIFSKFLVV